jgi:hypothetical protein
MLAGAVRLDGVRLGAGDGGRHLSAGIHTVLGAVAVVPWNPQRQQNRSGLPPTGTADELGQRSSIERVLGRICSLFRLLRLQRPLRAGWSASAARVALTSAATSVVA